MDDYKQYGDSNLIGVWHEWHAPIIQEALKESDPAEVPKRYQNIRWALDSLPQHIKERVVAMAKSTGNEPKQVGKRPIKGVTGITGRKPAAAKGSPPTIKTRRGVAHTPMHSDTPSGKGQRRHY